MLDRIAAHRRGLCGRSAARKFREEDIDLLLSIHRAPTGISYVYLEPFMEIEVYYGVIAKFHAAGIHQHMYTNGILANEENLRALASAGLDELRFNLGATNCADRVIENMAIAKTVHPARGHRNAHDAGIFRTRFCQKKDAILATGIDSINCAELHLNENNLANYAGRTPLPRTGRDTSLPSGATSSR